MELALHTFTKKDIGLGRTFKTLEADRICFDSDSGSAVESRFGEIKKSGYGRGDRKKDRCQ